MALVTRSKKIEGYQTEQCRAVLEEIGLLRGVPLFVATQGLGSMFRDNSGSEATFELSQPLKKPGEELPLSGFLSHSWRASGLLKAISLLHYFSSLQILFLPTLLCLCFSMLCGLWVEQEHQARGCDLDRGQRRQPGASPARKARGRL